MGRGGRGNQTGGASRNKVSQVAETSTREEAKEKRDDVNVLDDVERHSIAAAQTNSARTSQKSRDTKFLIFSSRSTTMDKVGVCTRPTVVR